MTEVTGIDFMSRPNNRNALQCVQTQIQNLEARNRSKIAAFAPHFPQLDKNIDAKPKFDVNKTIELAHIFFVIEMIRSDSRGRENYG